MEIPYGAAAHHITKALGKAGVQFPISRQELFERAGEELIEVAPGKHVTLREWCGKIAIDRFENKGQFFCALNGSRWSPDQIK